MRAMKRAKITNRAIDDRLTSEEFPDSKGRLPVGGHATISLRLAVTRVPTINRYLGSDHLTNLILGHCPICKEQSTNWSELKAHYESCTRVHHFPLLMRTCYCPYCRRKQSDGYALSNHIHHFHQQELLECRNGGTRTNRTMESLGIIAAQMRCPFPFYCTACKRCWPTAMQIAQHFVNNEEAGNPCRGTIHLRVLYLRGEALRPIDDDPSIICRYEFPKGVFCPYCDVSFTEAYELSRHCQARHSETMKQLRLRLVDAITTVPAKAYFYEPFVCSMCYSRFRSTEAWAMHVQERIYDGRPCFGELRVMKFCKKISGFVSNMFAHRGRETTSEEEMIRSALDLSESSPEDSTPPFDDLPTTSVHINDRFIRFDGSLSRAVKRELLEMEEEEEIDEDVKMDYSEVEVLSHSGPDPRLANTCTGSPWDTVFRIDSDELRGKVDAELRWAEEDRRVRGIHYIASSKELEFREAYEKIWKREEEDGLPPGSEYIKKEESMEDACPSSATVQARHQEDGKQIKEEPGEEDEWRVKEEEVEELNVESKREGDDLRGDQSPAAEFKDSETGQEHVKEEKRRERAPESAEPSSKRPRQLDQEQEELQVEEEREADISGYFRRSALPPLPLPPYMTMPLACPAPMRTPHHPLLTSSHQWVACRDCPVMCTSLADVQHHRMIDHTPQFNRPSSDAPLIYGCIYCKRFKCASIAESLKHEKDCSVYRLPERRERQLADAHACPYCKRRQDTAYALGAHIMIDHADILRILRFHHLMASEFLPFRCSKCQVGFEEVRMLMNHFRLKEEFGQGCDGILKVHNYQDSLMLMKKISAVRAQPLIPSPPYSGESDEEEDLDRSQPDWVMADCPADPLPRDTWTVQCPNCPEHWPRSQIKTHFKYDHPAQFYVYAPFKCKICKQFGFYCSKHYAVHYESCSPDFPGIHDVRSSMCAPRWRQPARPSALAAGSMTISAEAGNEIRVCRLCPGRFTPYELLLHQKTHHTVAHFTDAPYHCQRCALIAFYNHADYREHVSNCTGALTEEGEEVASIYAISMFDVQKYAGVREKVDFPSYLSLVEAERRKYGTLAAFKRSHVCPLCFLWNSSLITFAEHFRECHPMRVGGVSYLCGGCGSGFVDVFLLKQHLKNQLHLGNSHCFDMASLSSEAATFPRGYSPLTPYAATTLDRSPQIPRVSTAQARQQNAVRTFTVPLDWRQEVENRPRVGKATSVKPPQRLLTDSDRFFSRPQLSTPLCPPMLSAKPMLTRQQELEVAQARFRRIQQARQVRQLHALSRAVSGVQTTSRLDQWGVRRGGGGGGGRAPSILIPRGKPVTPTASASVVDKGPPASGSMASSSSSSLTSGAGSRRITVDEQRALEAAHREEEGRKIASCPRYSFFNFVPASQQMKEASSSPQEKKEPETASQPIDLGKLG